MTADLWVGLAAIGLVGLLRIVVGIAETGRRPRGDR